MHEEDESKGWRVDKRIPIALLFTIASIGVGGAWRLSEVAGDVSRNKERIAALEQKVEPMPERLGVIQALLESMNERLVSQMEAIDRRLRFTERFGGSRQPFRLGTENGAPE